MTDRVLRRYLLHWLPRGALVATALLAPVIDRVGETVAGHLATAEWAETVREHRIEARAARS